MAHVVQDEYWRELGSLHGYLQMHEELFRMSRAPVPGLQVDGKAVVHESARLGSGVHFDDMVCIGAGCDLEHGVGDSEERYLETGYHWKWLFDPRQYYW